MHDNSLQTSRCLYIVAHAIDDRMVEVSDAVWHKVCNMQFDIEFQTEAPTDATQIAMSAVMDLADVLLGGTPVYDEIISRCDLIDAR